MKKKYINMISALFIVFQVFMPGFMYVWAESTKSEICSWPSEIMTQYLNFQKEIKSALQSNVDEKRFYASTGRWWLFTKWVLELPSAIDFLASNIIWNVKSNVSTAATSMVLILLAWASVLQSNTEWFAILFKSRPIVREYKEMLDIETEIFDLAYFQSKQINLTINLKEDIYEKINDVIKKYRKSWLLEENKNEIDGNNSMSDILMELISMNTRMKHFILYLDESSLEKYNWCFWKKSSCSSSSAILRFSDNAIRQLKNSYSGGWWDCNSYFSNFKNSITKSFSNNTNTVKSSFKDVKDAINRLRAALTGVKSSLSKKNWKKRCDDISDYEMAQLKAYWGQDWTCNNSLVNAQVDVSPEISELVWQVSEFFRNKKVQKEQRWKKTTLFKQYRDFVNEAKKERDSKIKSKKIIESEWYKTYSGTSAYNPEFLDIMKEEFLDSWYKTLFIEYEQVINDAVSSDISLELSKIRWLLDTIWSKDIKGSSMYLVEELRKKLKEIADYQCAS